MPPPDRSDPLCGHCRYCIRGITTLTCPECGSDLREVGIIAPNIRLPVDIRHLRAIIWTLALPIPAFCISWLLLSYVLPFGAMHKMDRRIQINASYLNIQLDIDAIGWPSQPGFVPPSAFRPDKFRIYDRNFTGLLEANLATGAYHHWWRNSPDIWQNAGFNGLVIATWLVPTGANPTDPRVGYAGNQIYKAISEMHQGTATNTTPLLDQSGNQIGSAQPATAWIVHDEPNPTLIALLALIYLFIWICGLIRIYRHPKSTVSP
jgi:hypothetical protein